MFSVKTSLFSTTEHFSHSFRYIAYQHSQGHNAGNSSIDPLLWSLGIARGASTLAIEARAPQTIGVPAPLTTEPPLHTPAETRLPHYVGLRMPSLPLEHRSPPMHYRPRTFAKPRLTRMRSLFVATHGGVHLFAESALFFRGTPETRSGDTHNNI